MTEPYNCPECELKDECFFEFLRAEDAAHYTPPCKREADATNRRADTEVL